jgi:uncharacterized membrane protein YdbT with pleckstrin-like domain
MSSEDDYDWLRLTDDESVQWAGQPRRKSIVPVALVVALVVTAVGLYELAFLLVALPIGALVIAWRYLRIVNTVYVLTDASVYRRSGVLGESVERASVAKIQNVDLSKGVVGNQFGFGTVEVSTAGGRGVRIGNVVDPEALKELVDEYAKRSEGVGMDAAGGAAGVDPRQVARLQREARQLRAVAESLEDTFTGGNP